MQIIHFTYLKWSFPSVSWSSSSPADSLKNLLLKKNILNSFAGLTAFLHSNFQNLLLYFPEFIIVFSLFGYDFRFLKDALMLYKAVFSSYVNWYTQLELGTIKEFLQKLVLHRKQLKELFRPVPMP